jgi:hypothetical protein
VPRQRAKPRQRAYGGWDTKRVNHGNRVCHNLGFKPSRGRMNYFGPCGLDKGTGRLGPKREVRARARMGLASPGGSSQAHPGPGLFWLGPSPLGGAPPSNLGLRLPLGLARKINRPPASGKAYHTGGFLGLVFHRLWFDASEARTTPLFAVWGLAKSKIRHYLSEYPGMTPLGMAGEYPGP